MPIPHRCCDRALPPPGRDRRAHHGLRRILGCLVLVVMQPYPGRATEPAREDAGVDLAVGFRYQSGDSVRQDIAPVSTGAVLVGEVAAYGERSRGRLGVRFETDVVAEMLSGGRNEDYQLLTLRAGPTVDLPKGWTVYGAAEGGGSFFDYEFLSRYAGGSVLIERDDEALLRSVGVGAGHEGFAHDLEENDAWLAGMDATLGVGYPARGDGELLVWPEFLHNHARAAAFRYSEFAVTVEYGWTVARGCRLFVDTAGWRRLYAGAEPAASDDRRDWYWSAGTTVIVDGVPTDDLAIELRYAFERNWSNDEREEYQAHVGGLGLRWVFERSR